MEQNETMRFNVERDSKIKAREIMEVVYNALKEKGYSPVNQIVGYFLSGDPSYITNYNKTPEIEISGVLYNISNNHHLVNQNKRTSFGSSFLCMERFSKNF